MTEDRYTDVGNARRLVAAHRHHMRWVDPWGVWMIYDGRRWHQDNKRQVVEFAKTVAEQLWDEARRLPDPELRKQCRRWADQAESASRIESMLKLARSEPGIPITPDELDAHHWLLNVLNGTLCLRTGQLRDHDPGDLITKLADTEFDPLADCPTFHSFLEHVVPSDGLRRFLKHWAGYCLTGDISEHKIVFAHGGGANGKSTFQKALASVVGDYAAEAAPDLLLRRHDDPHPTGLADLHGARMVFATETAEGRRLDEALVKRLTGGDPIKARRMHKDFFTFLPTHKFWVGTNHRPGVEGTDHGIWRRIRLFPFTVTIPDDRQDRELDTKLAREASGILNWALEGCLAWHDDGLTEPPELVAATADYRADMDVLGQFISDCCLLADGVSARASDLHHAYIRWAETEGERRPLSVRKFGLALRERGMEKRTSNGVWWDGIAIRMDGEAPRDPTQPSGRTNGTEPSDPHDELF